MNKNTSDKHVAILGEKLEKIRLLQNITQIDLAQKAGISARTLRRLESGQGGSMDSFIRVLMALEIDSNLSVLIPDSSVRPMERARPSKTERVRASGSKNEKGGSQPSGKSTWVWGDDGS